MKTQHPGFWQDVVGNWEIFPEDSATPIATVFRENLQFTDSEHFFCGPEGTPNYWTGETPEGTLFESEHAHKQGADKGKVSVQKMQFKRGQFMLVCNGKKMNYEDHMVFYGLTAAEAGVAGKARKSAEYKYAVKKSEDGSLRRFAYRRLP